MPCIDPKVGERLAEYEANLLHREERQRFEDHLLSCHVCAGEFGTMALTLEAVEALPQAWVVEELLSTGQALLRQASWEDAAETFRALLCMAPGHPEAHEGLRQAEQRGREVPRGPLKVVRTGASALRAWLSAFWHPLLAGVPPTAAATRPQEHVFHLDDGDIRVTCHWWTPQQDQPAMLRVTWQAHVTRPVEFWARFARPDDPAALLGEVRLGSFLEGDKVFTAEMLGFDPARDPWAFAILLREPSP